MARCGCSNSIFLAQLWLHVCITIVTILILLLLSQHPQVSTLLTVRQATAASQIPGGVARAGGKSDLPTARPGPGAQPSYSLVNNDLSKTAASEPHPEAINNTNSKPNLQGLEAGYMGDIRTSAQSHVGYASSKRGATAPQVSGPKGQALSESVPYSGSGGREAPTGLLGDILEDAFRSGEDRGRAAAVENGDRGSSRVGSSLQGHQQQRSDAGSQGNGRRGSETGAGNGW